MTPLDVVPIIATALDGAHKVLSAIEHVRSPFPLTNTTDAVLPFVGPVRIKMTFSPTADPVVDFSRGGVAVKI